MTSDRRALWRHRDFLRLWGAQAISAFGSRITRTALPIIAVKTLGQPESVVGVLAALQLAPGVVLAMFAGGMVDRARKQRILIAADLVRAVVVGSLTIAWLTGALTIVHVIAVGALVGAATALDQITDVAYLPSLIEPGLLADGNAKLGATDGIAEIAGPASAGVLIAAFGAPLTVVIDAVGYVGSAVLIGGIRAREPQTPRPSVPASSAPSDSPSGGAFRSLRAGIRAVFSHSQVRPIVLALMVWSILGGFFSALYVPYCLRTLDLPESTFGLIVAIGGVGALIGAALRRPIVAALGLGRTLIASAVISVSGAVLIPLASGSRPVVLALLGAHQLISDCFALVFLVEAITLRQTVLPFALLGRANAAIHVCTAGLVPIAAVAAGTLAELTTTRGAVWIGVSIGLVAPLMLWPLRHLRAMPPATGEATAASRPGASGT